MLEKWRIKMLKRLPYLMLMLFLAILAVSLRASAGQQNLQQIQQQKDRLRKPSRHSGLPVLGEFKANETEPPQDEERRQIREKRYGDHLPPITDPGPTIKGQTESTRVTFIDYVTGNSTDPNGIPASVSTAVVVGTILSGKCFVNKAHTFVYTDYQVRIDQVLKLDPTTNLTVGDSVTASRDGGAIHFPSGHVTNFLHMGQGLPEVGSQYVLFLWRSIPNLPEYEIIINSGYQLKDGRAYALDDANSGYDNSDANVLIGKIQTAIAGGARP